MSDDVIFYIECNNFLFDEIYSSAQKSPISPNRFDDAPSSASPLSPSQPGSLGTLGRVERDRQQQQQQDQGLSIPPERRRGFQIQGKAKALYNFNAQNPRELSFRKNDVIYLLRQVDKNWYEGEKHGVVGIFPVNYVEVMTSIEAARAAAMQAEGQGRAKYNFTAQSSVELSLRKVRHFIFRLLNKAPFKNQCVMIKGIVLKFYLKTCLMLGPCLNIFHE